MAVRADFSVSLKSSKLTKHKQKGKRRRRSRPESSARAREVASHGDAGWQRPIQGTGSAQACKRAPAHTSRYIQAEFCCRHRLTLLVVTYAPILPQEELSFQGFAVESGKQLAVEIEEQELEIVHIAQACAAERDCYFLKQYLYIPGSAGARKHRRH